jgi:hypothetical protein
MQEHKEIAINSDTKVKDVQTQFEAYYPFLTIEFSKNKAAIFARSHNLGPDNIISKISNLPAPVNLNVNVERTIAEVEKQCHELLGLSVQIFRKSGNVCNAISITNSWTLQIQNMAGEFISAEMHKAS